MSPYSLSGIFNTSGYLGIVMLAYLFRVHPSNRLSTINNVNVTNIQLTSDTTGFWRASLVGGEPQLTLNMRNIYNAINNNTHFTNKLIGRIKDPFPNDPNPQVWDGWTWYYVMYQCNPTTGTPLKASLNNTKYNSLPIILTIDDSNLEGLPEIYDSAIFGLAKQPYCDSNGNLINRLTSPIELTV